MLKTLSAVIYLPPGLANANQALKVTVKSDVQTSMSVRDQDHVESTLIVSTQQETIRVYVEKGLRGIHLMVVPTSMNVNTPMLVGQVLSVQILREVIAATALKVSMEMPDQQVSVKLEIYLF